MILMCREVSGKKNRCHDLSGDIEESIKESVNVDFFLFSTRKKYFNLLCL